MRERFFEPGIFAAFCEGFTAELRRMRRELGGVEREIQKILGAIEAGVPPLTIKEAMIRLEAPKAILTAALAEPPLPAFHARMAEVYREKATALAAGLELHEKRDTARLALRGFLERIGIPPGEALLQVVGNVGVMSRPRKAEPFIN